MARGLLACGGGERAGVSKGAIGGRVKFSMIAMVAAVVTETCWNSVISGRKPPDVVGTVISARTVRLRYDVHPQCGFHHLGIRL